MTPEDWDRRYDTPRMVWSAEPNRFLVSEESATSRPGAPSTSPAGRGATRSGSRAGAGR